MPTPSHRSRRRARLKKSVPTPPAIFLQPKTSPTKAANVMQKYKKRFAAFGLNGPGLGTPMWDLWDSEKVNKFNKLLDRYNADMSEADDADAIEFRRQTKENIDALIKNGVVSREKFTAAAPIMQGIIDKVMAKPDPQNIIPPKKKRGRKPKYPADEDAKQFNAVESSGMTPKAYAADKGIDYPKLIAARKRHRTR
jgi:hypothetical protein